MTPQLFDHARTSHVADMMVVCTWFMLREIELSFAKNAHLFLEGQLVNFLLPVHKRTVLVASRCGNLDAHVTYISTTFCHWHTAERHLIRMAARVYATFSRPRRTPLGKHVVIQMFRHVAGLWRTHYQE